MKQISCIKVRFVSHTNLQVFSPVLLMEKTDVNLELLLESITTYKFYISFGQAPKEEVLKLNDFLIKVINLKLYRKVLVEEFTSKFLDRFYNPQFYIDTRLYNGEWYSFFHGINEEGVKEILHDAIHFYRGISKSDVPYCRGRFYLFPTLNSKIKELEFVEKEIIEISKLLNY